MSTKSRIVMRPWLTKKYYDLLFRSTVLHIDIVAYRSDNFKGAFFEVTARQAGETVLARDVYTLDGQAGLVLCPHAVELTQRIIWTRTTHPIFRVVHKALVRLAAVPVPGFVIVPHFHYIGVPDCDPWPRGMANGFRYSRKAGAMASDALPAPSAFDAFKGIL